MSTLRLKNRATYKTGADKFKTKQDYTDPIAPKLRSTLTKLSKEAEDNRHIYNASGDEYHKGVADTLDYALRQLENVLRSKRP